MRARIKNIDRLQLGVLAAFAAVSVWVLALDLWQVVVNGHVWTGADSIYGVDQFQYMAWIRDASRHGLVSNLFVLESTRADYFQPAIVISGGLAALGVTPWLSLLFWKPVAVVALFYAVRGYVNLTVADRRGRLAALALALFFGSFTVVYGSVGTIGDLFPGFLTWGYPFAVLALAAMVWALMSYDRARALGNVGSGPGLLGAAASALHPWHGALLIMVLVSAELLMPRHRPATRNDLARPAVAVALTALPLAYYALLGRIDMSWGLARVASKHTFPLSGIVVELIPLLLAAALAYRKRPRSFLMATCFVWPIAAFVAFGLSSTQFAATPLHVFQGITIPLSVLAIDGVRRAGFSRLSHPRVWGSVLVAAFTIPATVWQLDNARRSVSPRTGNSNFVSRSERRALEYLAHDPRPGGVISRLYLGQLVPAETGRRTFVGDCLWSQPRCPDRLVAVRKLFTGQFKPTEARDFVRAQGARFLLADCRQMTNLVGLLGPVITAVHRFGCAEVYEVE